MKILEDDDDDAIMKTMILEDVAIVIVDETNKQLDQKIIKKIKNVLQCALHHVHTGFVADAQLLTDGVLQLNVVILTQKLHVLVVSLV